jgi:hypothetical protein
MNINGELCRGEIMVHECKWGTVGRELGRGKGKDTEE